VPRWPSVEDSFRIDAAPVSRGNGRMKSRQSGKAVYDQRYFDKWYRDPRHRVNSPSEFRRKVAMVVAIAEYYRQRPIRAVLDIGCGEGNWQVELNRLRPGIRYLGIDPSEYAVARFGRRRNLLQGTFGELSAQPLAAEYDLILCSNTLYYVEDGQLDAGLREIVTRLTGVAFIEAYASDEELEGDTRAMHPRNAAFYRKLFRRHHLRSCGPHCYVGPRFESGVTDFERGGV